jgi:hypothetical protein
MKSDEKKDYGVCTDCKYFNPRTRGYLRCRSLGTATGTYGIPCKVVFCSMYRRKGDEEEGREGVRFASQVWELPEEWFKDD